ncbi:hypothetical protein [Microbacterium gubbeenense]|uniref:hypothetical protein n=1 Tax=Microbacterium gubbeenense TaxID=159896 RepID=UPI003F99C07E
MRAEKKHQLTRKRARRLTKKTLTAGGVVTTLAVVGTFAGIGVATADIRTTEADSAAHAHLLWLEGLGLDVADAGVTQSEFAGTATEDDSSLDASVLEGLVDIDLGDVSVPLIKPTAGGPGLLHLGALGLLEAIPNQRL